MAKKLPRKLESEIALFCWTSVSEQFAIRSSPTFDDVTWENFEGFVKRICRVGIFINIDIPLKYQDLAKDTASKFAIDIANRLMRLRNGEW